MIPLGDVVEERDCPHHALVDVSQRRRPDGEIGQGAVLALAEHFDALEPITARDQFRDGLARYEAGAGGERPADDLGGRPPQ